MASATALTDESEEPVRQVDATQGAIVASFILWLSSFLYYVATRPSPAFADEPLWASAAAMPPLVLAGLGVGLSLAYLTWWPMRHGRKLPGARPIVIYLSGLILGYVLWRLLILKQDVSYLETLGTLTVAGVIALVIQGKETESRPPTR